MRRGSSGPESTGEGLIDGANFVRDSLSGKLPATDCGKKSRACFRVKPACVANKVVVEGDKCSRLGVKNTEEIVSLTEGEFGVAKSGHGRERGGLCIGKGADEFVALEESVERGQVDVNVFRRRAGHKCEPVDDVSLDGLGEIVDGVGAVGEAEVDDCRGTWVGIAGPENVGGVEIVVGPRGRECAQMRAKLVVERFEQRKGLLGVALGGRINGKGWSSSDIARHCRNRVVGGEDSEAGNERAIETSWSWVILCGEMEFGESDSGCPSVRGIEEGSP